VPRRRVTFSTARVASSSHFSRTRASVALHSSLMLLWLANSQSCRKDERTRVRSFGPEQPGPNLCCAFHAGSLRDGAPTLARAPPSAELGSGVRPFSPA
jgi:hypothetical protein